MKFYCIIEGDSIDSQNRYSLLEKSCIKKQVDFVKLEPKTFNYLNFETNSKSLVYRATGGIKSRLIEKYLLNSTPPLFLCIKI